MPHSQGLSNNPSPVGLGGLGVTCSPRDPRFAGSKNSKHKCSGREISGSLKNLKPEKIDL